MAQLLLYCLAGIGAGIIATQIIIPIIKGLMYATGYTLFTWWKWNPTRVKKVPLLAIKQSFKAFIEGFVLYFDYGNTEHITSGKKRWYPYFRFERL